MQSGQNSEIKVAVVGAGTMGASITVAFIQCGIPVILNDVDHGCLERGLATIDRLLAGRVKKGLSQEEADKQRSMITTTTDFGLFGDADLVIEAVPEKIEFKESVFTQLDEWCNVDAVLATNTSSLSITRIGAFTRRPDKVVGMHFFNPAHLMKLVEVIPGLDTSQETVAFALEVGKRLGKVAVRVEECASFLVNRLLGRYMNESLWCLQEGLASIEEIDKAAQDLVMPVGPLALRDMNGADIGLAVANFNHEEYGQRFCPPAILGRMVGENLLGQKTMQGFYLYDEETRKRKGPNPRIDEFVKPVGSQSASSGFTAERLFLPMINEAFLAVQEKVCALEDLDAALMAGLGMRKGPLALASSMGLANCLEQIEALYEECGERFRPAPLLKRYVWGKKESVLDRGLSSP